MPAPSVIPFIGQILLVPYDKAPSGWAFCEGQLIKITDNPTLYALLGTTFGASGDGTAFALPDLRGRVPLGAGYCPGLESYRLSQQGGAEYVQLTADQMPAHTHGVQAVDADPNTGSPQNAFLADTSPPSYFTGDPSSAPATMAGAMVSPAGGDAKHENRPPYLALNYIIALKGAYPALD